MTAIFIHLMTEFIMASRLAIVCKQPDFAVVIIFVDWQGAEQKHLEHITLYNPDP